MPCQLKYGSYEFPLYTTLVPMESAFEFNLRGQRIRQSDVWRVRTVLVGTGEADIKAKTIALDNALSDGGSLQILQTDGQTATAHTLADCTVLTRRYPESSGPELYNRRTVEIEFRSITRKPGESSADDLVSFQESFDYYGGGPRYVIMECMEGPPLRYRTAKLTAYHCTQRGSATARDDYPLPPGSRFPDVLMDEPSINKEATHTSDGEARYTLRWEYRHASPEPIDASPQVWPE